MSIRELVAALIASSLLVHAAAGQPEDEPLPTLDELLGLDGDDEQQEAGKETDAADAELDRVLEQTKPIADEFLEAIELMHESATRLSGSTDTGIVTQRLQEDILRRLDKLIDRAGEQSSSSSSSSKSEAEQKQQQPNQQRRDESQANVNDNQDESSAPGGQEARLGAQATLDGARWGNLPERLRDALLQGSSDSYSSLYKSMTETYYKRLAEEASE